MVFVYATMINNLPDPAAFPECLEGLLEDRKEKTLRYKQEIKRKQSLGAGLLLNHVFKLHGINVNGLTCGKNGKPEAEGICFNISHSHDMVVCALSEHNVGCDVEKIRSISDGMEEHYFTSNENLHLRQYNGAEKLREFFRIWTMKESYIKMTGEGTSLGLSRVEFELGDHIKVFREGTECSCSVKEYDIPGYRLSVCAEETEFSELNMIEL